MNVDRKRLQLAMARACMRSSDLPTAARLPRATVQNALSGKSVLPATIGKIAKALNVDSEEIIKMEE